MRVCAETQVSNAPPMRYAGRASQLWGLLVILPVVSAFLPPPSRLVGTPAGLGGSRSHAFATRTVRGRGAISCTLTSEDKTVINGEFDELLASKDILKTIDLLRKHRNLLDLDWSKVRTLCGVLLETRFDMALSQILWLVLSI